MNSARLHKYAGIFIVWSTAVWTVLSIWLTDEPPNVLAMSGLALVLSGVLMWQEGINMEKTDAQG